MSTENETHLEIQFVYRQTGRKKTSGALTATEVCGDESKILLIDSFDLAFEQFRRRFIRRLFDEGLSQDLFPAEVLSQDLLEMANDSLNWGKPKEKKIYAAKDHWAFERLMEYHSEKYPDLPVCEITRVIPAVTLKKG